jgi:hypothetical protein
MKDEKGNEIPDSGTPINNPIGGVLLVEPTETKPVTDATRDPGKITEETKSFYCSNPQPMSKEDKKEDKKEPPKEDKKEDKKEPTPAPKDEDEEDEEEESIKKKGSNNKSKMGMENDTDEDEVDYYFQTHKILIIGGVCLILVGILVYYFLFRDKSGRKVGKSKK